VDAGENRDDPVMADDGNVLCVVTLQRLRQCIRHILVQANFEGNPRYGYLGSEYDDSQRRSLSQGIILE
jgi:hypothetical protein